MFKNIVVLILQVMLVLGAAAGELEFSADVQTTVKGVTTGSKMSFGGDKWRLETTAAGKTTVSIARQDRKLVWVLLPEQQLYMEQKMKPEQQRGLTQRMAGELKRQKLGSETVNGMVCDKYEVTYKEGAKRSKLYQWMSADGWPVRSAALDGSWRTEFNNIKKGAQPAALFEVPAGYNLINVPGMKMVPGMRTINAQKSLKWLPGQ